MPANFDRVSDEIYRGGEPSAEDLKVLFDVFGVKTILSLDGTIASQISSIVKSLGMKHIIVPISGFDSFELMKYLQNHIISILNNNQPIYIHCRHGSDRTGMAVALYRINQQGWSVDDALREAESYGFGRKVDPNTRKLYESIIKKKAEEDIVGLMRDQFNMGNVPPAFLPQQSFAPKEDVKFWPPIEPIEDPSPLVKDPFAFRMKLNYPSSNSELKKQELRKMILNEIIEFLTNQAPQVANYDNFDGIRGAGPVAGDDENSGGFVSDEGGGLPGGASSVNTGGFINL